MSSEEVQSNHNRQHSRRPSDILLWNELSDGTLFERLQNSSSAITKWGPRHALVVAKDGLEAAGDFSKLGPEEAHHIFISSTHCGQAETLSSRYLKSKAGTETQPELLLLEHFEMLQVLTRAFLIDGRPPGHMKRISFCRTCVGEICNVDFDLSMLDLSNMAEFDIFPQVIGAEKLHLFPRCKGISYRQDGSSGIESRFFETALAIEYFGVPVQKVIESVLAVAELINVDVNPQGKKQMKRIAHARDLLARNPEIHVDFSNEENLNSVGSVIFANLVTFIRAKIKASCKHRFPMLDDPSISKTSFDEVFCAVGEVASSRLEKVLHAYTYTTILLLATKSLQEEEEMGTRSMENQFSASLSSFQKKIKSFDQRRLQACRRDLFSWLQKLSDVKRLHFTFVISPLNLSQDLNLFGLSDLARRRRETAYPCRMSRKTAELRFDLSVLWKQSLDYILDDELDILFLSERANQVLASHHAKTVHQEMLNFVESIKKQRHSRWNS